MVQNIKINKVKQLVSVCYKCMAQCKKCDIRETSNYSNTNKLFCYKDCCQAPLLCGYHSKEIISLLEKKITK